MKVTAKLSIGAKILAAKLRGEVRPFFVQYMLLNGCDARCVYCNFPNRTATQLSTAEHQEILREFARLGTVRVKFHGGEPLLRKDLGELIAEVKRLGMRAAMVTNGLLLPERMDAVRQLDELIISLDGDEGAAVQHAGDDVAIRFDVDEVPSRRAGGNSPRPLESLQAEIGPVQGVAIGVSAEEHGRAGLLGGDDLGEDGADVIRRRH